MTSWRDRKTWCFNNRYVSIHAIINVCHIILCRRWGCTLYTVGHVINQATAVIRDVCSVGVSHCRMWCGAAHTHDLLNVSIWCHRAVHHQLVLTVLSFEWDLNGCLPDSFKFCLSLTHAMLRPSFFSVAVFVRAPKLLLQVIIISSPVLRKMATIEMKIIN